MVEISDSETAQPRTPEEGGGEEPARPQSAAAIKTHKFRWLSLCVASSAATISMVLAIELRQGLPLEFVYTLLLAALVGIGLPALLVMLVGNRLKSAGIARTRLWVIACAILIFLCLLILII